MSQSSMEGINNSSTVYCQNIIQSRWTALALIVGCIASLAIGIAASAGGFQFIGTTNASYLSYGMYGGAALLLAAVTTTIFFNFYSMKTKGDDQVTERSKAAYSGFYRPVPENYISPAVKKSKPLSDNAIKYLKQKAFIYGKTHGKELSDEQVIRIKEYINKVIDDAEFKSDPLAYMSAWFVQRGYRGDNFRDVEDRAHSFFEGIIIWTLKNIT